MNRIYKVIWNKARGAYAVVSEVAKARGKAPGNGVKRAALLAAALLVLGGAVPQVGMAAKLSEGDTFIRYEDTGILAGAEVGRSSQDGYKKITYGLDNTQNQLRGIVEARTRENGIDTIVKSTYDGKAGTAETWVQVGGSSGASATMTTSKDGTTFSYTENQKKTSTTIKGDTVSTGTVNADTVQVKTLKDQKGNTVNLSQVAGMQTALDGKADKADVYTRTEAEGKFAAKTDLDGKADATDVYSKSDAEGKFAAKTDLDSKANVTDVYKKTEVDDAIAEANPIVGSVYKGTDGGEKNEAFNTGSTVTGGWKNTAGGNFLREYASVSGGAMNKATGRASSISGGQQNEATGTYAAVGGGESNTAEGGSSSISGGRGNTAQAYNSSISGGQNNKITYAGTYASILGGEENTASGDAAAVGGGYQNKASGGNSFVAGGTKNTAYGVNTTAIGGTGSEVRGAASVGIGGGSTKRQAKNAVAIGNGSMATEENEISFGDAADTTKNHKLTNIADGSADTDAASVGQVNAVKNDVTTALAGKADASSVYTKGETDKAVSSAISASETKLNGEIGKKADASAVTANTNTLNDHTARIESLEAVASKGGQAATVQAVEEAHQAAKDAQSSADNANQAAAEAHQAAREVDGRVQAVDNKLDQEMAERKAADQTLQENLGKKADQTALAAETTAREKADQALQVSLSGKASQTALDTEKADREAADSQLQDQINDHAGTLTQHADAISNIRQELNDIDADTLRAEGQAAREAADTAQKRADEAHAMAVSMQDSVTDTLKVDKDGNVLHQTVTVDSGTVKSTTAKQTSLTFNGGTKNQVTINDTGIRIGQNSGQIDDEGFYAGGHTYAEAKSAISADGSIKGAGGNFTVDKDGTVSIDATDSNTGKKVTHDSSSTFGPERIHQQTQTWNGNRNEGTLSSMQINDSGATFELTQFEGEEKRQVSSSSTQIAGGTITVSDDKGNRSQLRADGLTVGGNFAVDANGKVSAKGMDAGGAKVSGVAAGEAATDAVNVGQLAVETQNREQAVSRLSDKLSRTNKEVDQVGAMSMAIAGLHPLSYDEGDARFQLSAAMGTYDGTQALALGGFYHFNRDAMLSIGMTTDLSDADKFGANIGFTRRIGSGGRSAGEPSYTDLKEQLRWQDEKIARQDEQIAKQGEEIAELKEMVKQLAAKA